MRKILFRFWMIVLIFRFYFLLSASTCMSQLLIAPQACLSQFNCCWHKVDQTSIFQAVAFNRTTIYRWATTNHVHPLCATLWVVVEVNTAIAVTWSQCFTRVNLPSQFSQLSSTMMRMLATVSSVAQIIFASSWSWDCRNLLHIPGLQWNGYLPME